MLLGAQYRKFLLIMWHEECKLVSSDIINTPNMPDYLLPSRRTVCRNAHNISYSVYRVVERCTFWMGENATHSVTHMRSSGILTVRNCPLEPRFLTGLTWRHFDAHNNTVFATRGNMSAKMLSETTLLCYQRVCFNKHSTQFAFLSDQLHVKYNQPLFDALVAYLQKWA